MDLFRLEIRGDRPERALWRSAAVRGYDQTKPDEDSGFVRAESAEEALALIGNPDATVVHLAADAEWPGESGESIYRES